MGLFNMLWRSFKDKLFLVVLLDGLIMVVTGVRYAMVPDSLGLCFSQFILCIIKGTEVVGMSDSSVIANSITYSAFQAFTFSLLLLGFQDFFKRIRDAG